MVVMIAHVKMDLKRQRKEHVQVNIILHFTLLEPKLSLRS